MKLAKSAQKQPLEYALKLLSYRPRSEHEISFRLKIKQVPVEKIALVIKKLKELKFIDDDQFVTWWQQQRDEFRPKSARILKLELIKKGIDSDTIASNLDDSYQTELDRATKAFQKKFKSLKTPMSYGTRQKVIRFMSARGFSWAIIKDMFKADSV